jgi:uncharacterized protein
MEENKLLTESERNWAMLCHLSAFSGFFFPFGGIIGPLIFWLSRKDDSVWVNLNGKAALNFNLSVLMYVILSLPLMLIIIGIPIVIALGILKIVCITIASIKAARGEIFRYPLTIPFFQ